MKKKNQFNHGNSKFKYFMLARATAVALAALATYEPLASANTQAPLESPNKEEQALEDWHQIRQMIITGNAIQALRQIQSSKIRKESSEFHFLLGRIHQELRQNTLALASYSVSLYIKPDQAKAYINRALVRGALQDLPGAIDDLNAALRLEPNNADAYLNRGVSHASLNQPQQAIDDFRKALKLRRSNPEAHLNLGLVFYFQGNKEKACDHWSESGRQGSKEALSWTKEWCLRAPAKSRESRASEVQ